MKVVGRYERILLKTRKLKEMLSAAGSDGLREMVCEVIAREICDDLFVIKCNEGDEYIDCRVGVFHGVIKNSNGENVDLNIEHGNLTTGEVVVINTEKRDDNGKLEREIVQHDGPLTYVAFGEK